MDPPTKLIFLTEKLISQLNEVLIELEKNDAVSVVILTGRGNSFATGADIGKLHSMDTKKAIFDDNMLRNWWRIHPTFRKPIIAAINGMCFGGGLEISMTCDILLATEDAKLGQPEVNLGIFPGSGGTVRLTKLVGKSNAMKMVLSGEPISGKEAFDMGLVS